MVGDVVLGDDRVLGLERDRAVGGDEDGPEGVVAVGTGVRGHLDRAPQKLVVVVVGHRSLLVGVMRDRDGGLVLVDERFREEGGAAVEPQIPDEDQDRLSGRYPQERCPGRSRGPGGRTAPCAARSCPDRKSTRLNSSHVAISYAVFCLKKKNTQAV